MHQHAAGLDRPRRPEDSEWCQHPAGSLRRPGPAKVWGEGGRLGGRPRWEGSDFASEGFCASECQARAVSCASEEPGLQQQCFSLGFPEGISCFLIQTIRRRVACAESPNACRKKAAPMPDKGQPRWGSGQGTPEHRPEHLPSTPGPAQALRWPPPRACSSPRLHPHPPEPTAQPETTRGF